MLTDICSTDFQNVLSAREFGELSEFSQVLAPFVEATDLTQDDNFVTISLVVSTVLDLHSHLKASSTRVRYCRPIVDTLTSSLKKRFKGVFISAKMLPAP